MIDTNKAREMRAKGTQGRWTGCRTGIIRAAEWVVHNNPSDDGAIMSEPDAELIAYAVNFLEPMADEIDRLRALLDDARVCFVPDTQMTAQQVKIRDRVEYAVGATTRDPDVVRPRDCTLQRPCGACHVCWR